MIDIYKRKVWNSTPLKDPITNFISYGLSFTSLRMAVANSLTYNELDVQTQLDLLWMRWPCSFLSELQSYQPYSNAECSCQYQMHLFVPSWMLISSKLSFISRDSHGTCILQFQRYNTQGNFSQTSRRSCLFVSIN